MIATTSCICLAIGHFLIGISRDELTFGAGLVFTASGSGFPIALRSMLTILVPTRSLGALYTIMSVVDSSAIALAGPLLAVLYHMSLSLGHAWFGLPYFVTSGLHVAAYFGI
jgi:hypothetical protein